MPTPDEFYTKAQRELQAAHDSENLSEAVVQAIVTDDIPEPQIPFIESRDFFFLSTVNSKGEPTVSYKGGPAGFLNVENPSKLIFPIYDGNGMFLSAGNIKEMGKVGLLLIDFETPNRLRIQGDATVSEDADLCARFSGAVLVVIIDVTVVFVNCARYIHPHNRVETSKYVPDEKGEQPFPAWKRIDDIQPALPVKDKGRAESEGGVISEGEYIELVMTGKS